MKKESDKNKSIMTKPMHKALTGSTFDKFPILMEDGKTIIFISDKSKETDTRLRYKALGRFSKI